jgi:hypothetical protein
MMIIIIIHVIILVLQRGILRKSRAKNEHFRQYDNIDYAVYNRSQVTV